MSSPRAVNAEEEQSSAKTCAQSGPHYRFLTLEPGVLVSPCPRRSKLLLEEALHHDGVSRGARPQARQYDSPPRRSQLTGSTVCYLRDARFIVAQAAQRGDCGLTTAGNPGNVGLKRYAGEFDNGRNAVKYIKLLLLAAQNASWV
jgi:hypothetical protein